MNRSFWIWTGLLVLSLIIGPWWFGKTFPDGCNCFSGEASAATTPAATTNEGMRVPEVSMFSLADGNLFQAEGNRHFTFGKSSNVPDIPNEAMSVLQKTADYLRINADRMLTITGFYTAEEQNPTDFDNLGLARADTIVKQLIQLGAPATSLATASQLKNSLSFSDNLLAGKDAIAFEFSSAANEANVEAQASSAIEELGEALKAKPLNVYFEHDSDNIALTDEIKKYIEDTKAYFAQVPGAKLTVTGHTDNRGSRAYNVDLARRRALLIVNYLTRQGIEREKLVVDSKGPDSPIANNTTDSGRARNRRVEIRVIE